MLNPPSPLGPERQRALLAHAAESLRAAAAGEPLPPTPVALAGDPLLATHHGCFVTLRRADGELRGCIGTFVADGDLVATVARMTRQAALADPRFAPVAPDEVASLFIGISVLGPRQVCADPESIVPGRHGVEIERRGRRGVFLPQVATEQGWGRERLLIELCRKAGLPPDAWRSPESTLRTFEAAVFGEAE